MKLNKLFMLGLAGLAFAACGNEDDPVNNRVKSENGVVAVKIIKPSVTRTLSPDGVVAITGVIDVTLTGTGADQKPYNETISISTDELKDGTELKFWNISVPEKLTATINEGKNSYADVAITTLWQIEPAKAPAYGEVSKDGFKLTGGTLSPDLSEDGKTEAGAEQGDNLQKYDVYEATVTMAIPMARLEVGDITFTTPSDGTESIFATLIYTGCYLDKYATFGATYSNGAFPAVTGDVFTNYWYEDNAGAAGQIVADLKYAASPNHNFVNSPITEAGTFNFYAGSTNPQFKLYFEDGSMNPKAETTVWFPRYAMITKYLNNAQEEIELENGHIYKITGVTLDDDNIIPDEEGNTLYGVAVTVVEAEWQVETVTGGWVEI